MKDKLSFPAFTHDSIAGYCNDKPLYAQYKNDKKSKYIGTKQMWQELSKLSCDLEIARKALEKLDCEYNRCRDEEFDGVDIDWVWWAMAAKNVVETALKQIEHKDEK